MLLKAAFPREKRIVLRCASKDGSILWYVVLRGLAQNKNPPGRKVYRKGSSEYCNKKGNPRIVTRELP